MTVPGLDSYGPGYSKTAAAPIPVPMHMDTTPYALRQSKGRVRDGRRRPRRRVAGRDQPLASAPQLVEQRHHLASAGAAQRVAQGDGAAVRIHLLQRDSQLLHAVQRLRNQNQDPP